MKPTTRRHPVVIRTLVALLCIGALLAGTTVHPAGAAGKIDIDIRVVVKADSADAAADAASKEKATFAGALRADRGLYAIEKTVEDEPKNTAKLHEELAKELTKDKSILWAVPASETVDDTLFFAWPSGNLRRDDDGPRIAELADLTPGPGAPTGAGVVVAVLDSGFDLDHPLLEERLLPGIDLVDGHRKVSDWKNGVDDDGDGRVDEAHGHGTFVAGVIAQLAPDARILPIRVLDADGVGEMHTIIDGIDEAVARGADVINVSFGTTYKSKAMEEAVKRAQKAGAVVVASAGNSGSEVKQYPAALEKVVAVAAYDFEADGVAPWGTYGKWVDVSAPGVGIVSSRPGGKMGTWSGSSVSAPVVSSLVALLVELDSKHAGKDAEKLIRKSARKSHGERRSSEGLISFDRAVRG